MITCIQEVICHLYAHLYLINIFLSNIYIFNAYVTLKSAYSLMHDIGICFGMLLIQHLGGTGLPRHLVTFTKQLHKKFYKWKKKNFMKIC